MSRESESTGKPAPSGGSRAAQLRADIDAGRTKDKVGFPDPAAAPLGTDEEAAGTRLDAEAIQDTRVREVDSVKEQSMSPRIPRRGGRGLGLIVGVLAVLAVVFMIAYGMWREEMGEDGPIGEIETPATAPAESPQP